jgi:hypothetical protein
VRQPTAKPYTTTTPSDVPSSTHSPSSDKHACDAPFSDSHATAIGAQYNIYPKTKNNRLKDLGIKRRKADA